MTRLRFSTAQQVINAFPDLDEVIPPRQREMAPLAFVDLLLSGPEPEHALSFLAFLLPRREAVHWLCQSLRRLSPALSAQQLEVLATAETWVRAPSEQSRRKALEAGTGDKTKGPASWAAFAAGWSGGNMTNDENHPVPPPTSLTGQAVRVGMAVATTRVPQLQRAVFIKESASSAIALLNRSNA